MGEEAILKLSRFWNDFVSFVRQKDVALGECLVTGTLETVDDEKILLRYKLGFSYQKSVVEDAGNNDFLCRMIAQFFGRNLKLICIDEAVIDINSRLAAWAVLGDRVEIEASRHRILSYNRLSFSEQIHVVKAVDSFLGWIWKEHWT